MLSPGRAPRPAPLAAAALLPLLLAAAAAPAAAAADAGGACGAALADAIGRGRAAGIAPFIDAATPAGACTRALCGAGYETCGFDRGGGAAGAAPGAPLEDLVLVFSDEFDAPGRDLSIKARDPRWHAADMWYAATADVEVYKPEQATTGGGALLLTLEAKPSVARAQTCGEKVRLPDGECTVLPEVRRDYASGFVSTWAKFAYTGGYAEASVRLPGGDAGHFYPGFWPGFWMMGSLARAGYMHSTEGFWPYSYSTCGRGSRASEVPWTRNQDQSISACPDPPGLDRAAAWGMAPGVGRAAPEFDAFEVMVNSRNTGTAADPGAYRPPYSSQTLQVAPLLPPEASWRDPGQPEGVRIPAASERAYGTKYNSWKGVFSGDELPRPGNEWQDSVSTTPYLSEAFYRGFHTFGVDWRPGEWLRWYIDGVMTAEINQAALVARQGPPGSPYEGVWVGERLIPLEPMALMLNLGMSESFGAVDYANLAIPATMAVDYVRVWQRRGEVNVGLDPPGFPTTQYIACNRAKFILNPDDGALVPDNCESGVADPRTPKGVVRDFPFELAPYEGPAAAAAAAAGAPAPAPAANGSAPAAAAPAPPPGAGEGDTYAGWVGPTIIAAATVVLGVWAWVVGLNLALDWWDGRRPAADDGGSSGGEGSSGGGSSEPPSGAPSPVKGGYWARPPPRLPV